MKMNKLLVVGTVGVLGLASNAFALAATDFDLSTATADLGLAVVAVLSVAVLIYGYKRVVGMFGR